MITRKPPKGTRDVNRLARFVVDAATGNLPREPAAPEKNPHAVALSKLGASKGGKARAKALSARKRAEIAKKAASARWRKR